MDDVIWFPHDGWARLLADSVWQSTLIGCVGWLVVVCLRRRPAVRAHVAMIALALCLLTPLATWGVRHAGWGLLSASPAAEWNAAYPFIAESAPQDLPLSKLVAPPAARLPDPWTEFAWCVARVIWFLVTAWFVLRLMMSVCSLARLLRGRTPCRAAVVNAAARVAARQIGLRGHLEVTHGDAVTSPTVWSCGRSTTVILPPAACGQAHDWLSVFCHELAHARRGDPWGRLLAEIALALLPWQPFVWLLRRHYEQASEEACDDWAVALGCEPDELADTLVNWLPASGGAMLAPSLRSKVTERVRRLLSMNGSPRPELDKSWRAAALLVAVLLACGLALAQARPPRGHFEAHSSIAEVWSAAQSDALEAEAGETRVAAGRSRSVTAPRQVRRFALSAPGASHLRGCAHYILRLLALDEVQSDLSLTAQAYLDLEQETAPALVQLDELLRSAPSRTDYQQWWKWTREVATLNRDLLLRVEARLTPQQLDRLQQILLQTYGGAALLDPRVAGRLAMSPEQWRELRSIYAETSARLRELYAQTEQAGLPREAAQTCAAELRQERNRRLLGVLTPTQREAFDRLTGQKLKIDAAVLDRGASLPRG